MMKQRKKQWKMMKKREKPKNRETPMKNDEKEKKTHWKMMKKIEQNNEKWWKREEKTMKNDEQ
jgi:hypothetical protein